MFLDVIVYPVNRVKYTDYMKDSCHHTKALVDTGCAKTAMSLKFFERFEKEAGQQLPLTKPNISIVSCTGQATKIHGITTIRLILNEIENYSIITTAMVVDGLSDDFVIGQDIIGSKHVEALRADTIDFVDKYSRLIRTPLSNKTYQQIQCKSLTTCTIPPATPVLIACTATNTKHIHDTDTFMLNNTSIPHLTCLDVLYEGTQVPFHVAVYNEGLEDIEITSDDILFDIEIMQQNSVQINRIALDFDQEVHIPINATVLKQILKDKAFNQNDQEQQQQQFNEKGYFQPSISQVIQNKNTVTELEKVDDTPISDEEFIRQFDLHHLPEIYQRQALNIFFSNKQAFSLHKFDIGVSDILEMDVQLNTNEPKMQKYHPIPLNAREKVKEILDQLLRYGIIRECNEPSPYCSNILVVRKKDGHSIRLLFDGRLLNYDTKRLPMALISKPEILSHLVGKKWLTSLDFSDAFFNIKLSKEAQPLTAFYSHTHGLRMCFNRAPQGLRNSPLYLKLLLDKVFCDMTEHVLFYADDLLIATDNSLEHHLSILNKVLRKLVGAGLKLRPEKIFLAKEHIEFLGMIFQKGKIAIPEKKLEAFKVLPSPNTPKKCKSVISCLSYYRHFCPNFAELSHEIHELGSEHPKNFKWTPELELKYRKLIQTIIDNSILYLPDIKQPYYVQTDASAHCAGGRVFQKNDNQQEMLIAAVSRTFTKTERHYSIVKKEILALLYTLKTMDFFLRFAEKLIFLVDAKSIIFLRMAKESSGILLRFSLELSKYNAELHHIPGEQNIVSDVLSRHHKDIDNIKEELEMTKTISEKDTLKIIQQLIIPRDTHFTKQELINLIEGPSPLDEIQTKIKKQTRAKEGKRAFKNIPTVLGKKKLNLPKTTNFRPGMLLPANIMTRSKTKLIQEQTPITTPPTAHSNESQNTCESDPTAKLLSETPHVPQIENKLPNKFVNDDIEGEKVKTQNYTSIRTITRTIANGFLTIPEFKQAQATDEFCLQITQSDKLPKQYSIQDGILFYKNKIVLPENLTDIIVNTKHFTIFGSHSSASRILRELKQTYHIPNKSFETTIKEITKTCYLCQIYNTQVPQHMVSSLPNVNAPRQSWSIDIVTDTPTSTLGNTQILVCVDDFSSFTICIPIVSATSSNIIQALKDHIFAPFGLPNIIRSDEQASIYHSAEFFTFLDNLGIRLDATAVASPFSNARAESQIKNIKHLLRKFLFQQNDLENWDKEISILTSIHNRSVGIYGYSPEEIIFGTKNPSKTDLLSITEPTSTIVEYMNHILDKASELRHKARDQMAAKKKSSTTFKNKNRTLKLFELGTLVLHRQLQVSTGTSSKWKPAFKGPYVILQINNDACTAIMEHLHDGTLVKSHFTNMQKLEWSPDTLRFKEAFDEKLRTFNEQTIATKCVTINLLPTYIE
jgi:Reverse transcriptase (RNA-dependent DNA polymerase)/RNase H-like domain found in reverse transcriptase/Integrase core domain